MDPWGGQDGALTADINFVLYENKKAPLSIVFLLNMGVLSTILNTSARCYHLLCTAGTWREIGCIKIRAVLVKTFAFLQLHPPEDLIFFQHISEINLSCTQGGEKPCHHCDKGEAERDEVACGQIGSRNKKGKRNQRVSSKFCQSQAAHPTSLISHPRGSGVTTRSKEHAESSVVL